MPHPQKQPGARHRKPQRLHIVATSRRLLESRAGAEIVRIGPGSAVR